MRIRVRYHGPWRQDTGKPEETLCLDEPAVVNDALAELSRKYGPAFPERRDGLVCIMEWGTPKVVGPDYPLHEGASLLFTGIVESG